MSRRTDELVAALTAPRAADNAALAGPASRDPSCFADGRAFHVEIPSVEGPAALRAVVDEARSLGVGVDRVSQGSGVALLLDSELDEMAAVGREAGIEVVLWVGLRSSWDISAMARSASGATAACAVRGSAGLSAALEEAQRCAEAGIAGVLVADLGVLRLLDEAKRARALPDAFVVKTPLALACANPMTARCLVEAGATTINLPTDLPLADVAAIRSSVRVPLDCYVEGADDFAAPLRYHELAGILTAAAPVHLKFGLRNAAGIYPAGAHLGSTVLSSARERVRRAAIAMETLTRAGLLDAVER